MKFRFIRQDAGSALLEAVGFAVLVFGMILTAGLGLFQLQAAAIELQSIARNSVRSYVLGEGKSLSDLIQINLEASQLWRDRKIQVSIRCLPDCFTKPTRVRIELTDGQIKAEAFGVTGG